MAARSASTTSSRKNVVLTEAGRSPWYDANGTPREAYVIGVAGGSASGKTSVARAILQSIADVPWVAIVSQDSFYKELSKEQSKRAFENNYDFDHPNAFDYDLLQQCIADLKQSRAVEIPVYSFILHQRTAEKQYMYGPAIIIVEGIFVLHDAATRALLDLKIFVQADSDLMLARRIKRDMLERGRDVQGILDQYLRFVKPSMDNFVSATSRYADIIVPGQNNAVAIDVICQQIRRQLELRDEVRLRDKLSMTPATPRRENPISALDTIKRGNEGYFSTTSSSNGSLVPQPQSDNERKAMRGRSSYGKLSTSGTATPEVDDAHPLEAQLPTNVHVLRQTRQLRALLTIVHDMTVTGETFVATIDRMATLVMEASMAFLPYRMRKVTLANGKTHTGSVLDVEDVCSVSILRSGTVLESSARRVLPALVRGSVLIQSAADGEARLYTLDLPAAIKNRSRASKARVFVLDSQIGTGAAALMCIRVLLDHGVREDHILFCCLLASAKGGVHALHRAFPQVRIIVAGVDPDLKRRIVWDRVPVRRHKSQSRSQSRPRLSLDRRGSRDDRANGTLQDDDDRRNRFLTTHNDHDDNDDNDNDNDDESATHSSRVCFAICPGAGNIGDRYFGTARLPAVALPDGASGKESNAGRFPDAVQHK